MYVWYGVYCTLSLCLVMLAQGSVLKVARNSLTTFNYDDIEACLQCTTFPGCNRGRVFHQPIFGN